MIIMAVAQAGGVGGASVISRSLGAGRRKRAEKTAGAVFFVTWASGILLSFLWILLAPFLLRLMGTSGDILPLAEDYAAVLFLGAPLFAFSITANNFVRAEGNASFAMMTMIISAGINTLLDPLFILGFGWGRAPPGPPYLPGGTALWLGWYYLEGHSLVAFRWKHFRFRASILAECFSLGAAAFARRGRPVSPCWR
jgi:Na+-driven multidrug efflux pump